MSKNNFIADYYSYLARKIIAPLWANQENSTYLSHLKYLENSQYRPIAEVQADQWYRLKKLLFHAYLHTDYYSQIMKSAELFPDDICSWSDFTTFPMLTKEELRHQREAIMATNIPYKKLIAEKTSGYTGISRVVFVDEASRQWKRACTIRHDQWTGWRLGEKVGAFWKNTEYRKSWRGYLRHHLLERFTYLDPLRMDEAAMQCFYRKLRRRKPTLLVGDAQCLYIFASFLKKEKLNGLYPQGIINTAAMLHDDEQQLIEAVFDCKVINRYGCEEVGLIACECREHTGLHLNMDTLVVELIRDGNPIPPGEPGAIVVTDLSNYGMPIIRYKVGDVGVLSSRTFCNCGCTYPLMELI